MKKRLEAELISIAHRVLKLKNKSEIDQLYHETRKLYETLAVLKFYGDNYEQVKSDISKEDLEEKLADALDAEIPAVEDQKKPIIEPIIVEDQKEDAENVTKLIDEPIEIEESKKEVEAADELAEEPIEIEELKAEIEEVPIIIGKIDFEDNPEEDASNEIINDFDFEPFFELASEAPIEEKVSPIPEKKQVHQISFEDLLGANYTEPVFVKPNEAVIPPSLRKIIDEKPLSLNDQHSKAINIGLNDRIAFVKHLFADSNEDYNRVLSQLNSFSTYNEANDFIEEIIKPDYNNWKGSEEYAERFLEIVANKFN